MRRINMRPFDVVVVGEINPDIILHGDVVPVFGQVEKTVESGVLRIGSSSVIFACGAARLGLKVNFIGKVGDDAFGHFMLKAMHQHGVSTEQVIIEAEKPTGFSVILATGEDRAILTYPGLIPELKLSDIDPHALAQASHLHIGSYYLLDALRPEMSDLFALARHHQMTISLDTNYDPREQWDEGLMRLLKRVDILLINEVEAKAITGCVDQNAAMNQLAATVPTVAIKCGAEGAIGRQGNEPAQAPAMPAQVKDTVGAGDSFDAGFVYGYLAGWSLKCCLQLGVCCGTLSTREYGGTTAQPTLDEAQQINPDLMDCST